MKTRLSLVLAIVLTLGLTLDAGAHDDATLDATPSPHGGQVRMAGPYHFELLVDDNRLTVYVTDHAMQPIPTDGVSGNAIVLSGAKATIPLAATGISPVCKSLANPIAVRISVSKVARLRLLMPMSRALA